MLHRTDESLSGGRAELTLVDGGRFSRSARTADLEPFAVEVQRRDHVRFVQPRGELDIATVEMLRAGLDVAIAETLRAALDGFETSPRVVLDLRGLSFIDSTGLHLLLALDQRAQRDGFVLTLVAPGPPVDRAIEVSGLYELLPFVTPGDAVSSEPAQVASGT